MAEKRYVTAEEAISLLPDGDEIHTQRQRGNMFFGADWSRGEIVEKISKSDFRELTGPHARNMGHGLALYDRGIKYQSEILFVETDKARLDAFDPPEDKA